MLQHCNPLSLLAAAPAIPPLPLCILLQGCLELLLIKVWPHALQEAQLRVGALPQHEV
jgi:hypothetical protein